MTTPTSALLSPEDYAKLTIADEELVSASRARDVDYGPFPAWLRDSKEKNTGKAIVVPTQSARPTGNLIRRAATSIDLGCSVQYVNPDTGEHIDFTTYKGPQVKLRFAAKDKRTYDDTKPRKPTRRDAWTDTEYATALRDFGTKITTWLRDNGQADKIQKITDSLNADLATLASQAPPTVKPTPAAPARKSA